MLQPPPRCVQCLKISKPVLEVVVQILRLLAPALLYFYKFMYYLYLIIPANELRMMYGVALCFFGGEFCASIAAVECFRRSGGDKLLLCLKDLGTNMHLAHQASLEDDKATSSQQQLSEQEWYKRKVGVVLKAVEPDVLVQACAGLYQGFLGLMMALKFKFAWTVALACSIADLLRKPVAFLVTPCLAAMLPPDYHKWINQIINISLKLMAVHLAWKLEEVVSAVQSGLLGGCLFGTGVVILCQRGFSWASCGRCCKKKFDPETSYMDDVIGLPMAAAGIWFQLKHNFSLPFPFNLALLPLTIVEELLRFCITWFPVQDTVLPAARR
ncbi:unnamed protein product [Polarella glacialis]|uniref:Uncharacterized protein n=1 Tax=Polarella glacialis TaxID=89957 RepID=A0A813GML3_POLGL|nr:unnamed protein product [Polarella glacialis]CAE8733742.1 unnamed protein product [Polarella glacialis]